MRRIAVPWSRAFKSISVDIIDDVTVQVSALLTDFEQSATPLLEDCAREKVQQVQQELRGLLEAIVIRVKDVIDKEQKEANRCLVPHLRKALAPGYADAAPLSGPGSSARRKVCWMHSILYILVIENLG